MSDWDEFQSRLRKGEKVKEIVDVEKETNREKSTCLPFDEVKIGEMSYQLKPLIPTIDDVKVIKSDFSNVTDLVVPKPVIPVADMLPMQPVLKDALKK
ncbi:uncharacterized protein LOC143447481 [Clavelina lepadiformis]|uniref:uncharacterized protein LOC143447481 n=1 Tax=Clavelina lepadiformis TaxID=159417 RepID=UPI004041FD89